MRPARRAALAVACVVTGCVTGCVETTEGTPIDSDAVAARTTLPSSRAIPTPETVMAEPGIVPTSQTPVPAGTTTCEPDPVPPVGVTASVTDPAAPKITVALPSDWSTSKGDGDVGARLTGPDGITATVTISATQLDPSEAFKKYADDAMAASSVSSISILPADLCGYSGQKLIGGWSDSPQQAVEFGDRIAHIWTNKGNYLVAVHVQAPAGTSGFDPMFSPLMEDFGVLIP